MKKTFRNLFALMLICVMAASLFGTMAFADNTVTGENVTAIDGGSSITLTPASGYYVKDIKAGGKSIIASCTADITGLEVTIDTSSTGFTGPFTVETAEVPETYVKARSVFASTAAGVELKDPTHPTLLHDPDTDKYTFSDTSAKADYADYTGSVIRFINGAICPCTAEFAAPEIEFDVYAVYKINVPAPVLSEKNYVALLNGEAIDADVYGLKMKATVAAGNKLENVVILNGETDVTANCNVPTAYTTAAPTDITVTAPEVSVPYTGSAAVIPTDKTASVTAGTIAADDTIEATFEAPTQVNADTYTDAVKIDSVKVMHGDIDVSAFYTITKAPATLTVEKAKITVYAKETTAIYDGAAHKPDISYKDFAGTVTVTADVTNTQTKVGYSNSEVKKDTVTIKNGGVDITSNFAISTTSEGRITVIGRPVTITAKNVEANYNGSTISGSSTDAAKVDVTPATGLLLGHHLASVKTSYAGISIGSYPIAASEAKIVDASNNDVTDCYAITYVPGTFVIKADPAKQGTVTVSLGGALCTKVYDGESISTFSSYTLDNKAASVVGKVTVEINAASKDKLGPNVSTTVPTVLDGNDVTVKLFAPNGTQLNNADFNVVVNPGNVVISKCPINVNPSNVSKNYDGKAFKGEIKATSNFGKTTITVTADTYASSGDGIAVGNYTIIVDKTSFMVKNKAGTDITANFEPTFGEATLKVKASIGSANYSKSAGGTVTINCTLPVADFDYVTIDGVRLTRDVDYTISTGSTATVITYKNAYLKELAIGNHGVAYYYKNAGSISTNLTVTATGSTSSTSAPQTGDNSNMTLWIVILAICFVAVVAIAVVLFVQKKKNQVEG